MFGLPLVKFAIIGLVIAGILAFIASLYARLEHEQTSHARDKAQWQTERANAAQAAASASEAYRAKEQAWAASAAQIQKDGEERHAKIVADADRANRAAGSLRASFDLATRALRSAASASAPTASDCQAAAKTGDLLGELFRRADQRAGELSIYADQASAAGAACERAYDSLTR